MVLGEAAVEEACAAGELDGEGDGEDGEEDDDEEDDGEDDGDVEVCPGS